MCGGVWGAEWMCHRLFCFELALSLLNSNKNAKLIASSSKPETAAFSAVGARVHLPLHLCQVRQIFTEPGACRYRPHCGG